MKNIIKNIFIIITLILLFIKRPIVIKDTMQAIDLWSKAIFPSIFPIIILSDIIISTNIIEIISNTIGPIFKKLFKTTKYASYVFIMSSLTGSPSNAKFIKDLLDNKVISNEMAIKILSMTYLYNPLLIIAITPYLAFKDQLYFIILNIIINLIIGLINRNYNAKDYDIKIKEKAFSLPESISKGINILLLILGSLVIFNNISGLFNINHPLFKGTLELVGGLKLLNTFNITYKYKKIFTAILLSFGGISIITQIKSIFKDTPLDYSLFYKSRIIHLALFTIIISI